MDDVQTGFSRGLSESRRRTLLVLITDIFDEESFGFDDEDEFKVSVLTKELKNPFLMPFERDMYDEYHDLIRI